EQAFIHDTGKSVAQALKEAEGKVGAPIKVTGFVRYALGEGIEKQESDFAAEVAAASGKKYAPASHLSGGCRIGGTREQKATSEMAEPVYRRVVIKISGEYLAGSHGAGID